MTVLTRPVLGAGVPLDRRIEPGPPMPQAVLFLQVYAIALTVSPSDNVIKVVGATGHLAGLLGLLGLAWWLASALFRVHDPRLYPSPARLCFGVLWIVSLTSYLVLNLTKQPAMIANAADNWLLQLASWTGVGMVAIEACNSSDDFKKVFRALSIGGGICGAVAAGQFWFGFDLSQTLRGIPGFTQNYDSPAIIARYSQSRVAGTAIHPIELGVVASALLPITVCSAMLERTRSTWSRWLPFALLAICIPTSVSRSAILTVALSMSLFIACLDARRRLKALLVAPLAIAAVFMAAPGLMGTLRDYFLLGSRDPSVSTRQDDYPLVERLVTQTPWFGRGGGTYIADNALDILDNQFLKLMIEFGLIGTLLFVIALFFVPFLLAFGARKRSTVHETRLIGSALGSATAIAPLCSLTFDSLSFPMFAGLQVLLLGLVGAYWRLVRIEEHRGAPQPERGSSMLRSHDIAPGRNGATTGMNGV